MHYLKHKALSRRAVLRGMGATLALPLLETMMPADAQVIATFNMLTDPPSSALTTPEPHKPFTHGIRPLNHS